MSTAGKSTVSTIAAYLQRKQKSGGSLPEEELENAMLLSGLGCELLMVTCLSTRQRLGFCPVCLSAKVQSPNASVH
jgi:hypothetical protein